MSRPSHTISNNQPIPKTKKTNLLNFISFNKLTVCAYNGWQNDYSLNEVVKPAWNIGVNIFTIVAVSL